MKYNRKNYEIPSTEVYKGDKSIHKIIQLINESTDSEISKTFSSGIDDNIKKCMDVKDLDCIATDLNKCLNGENPTNLNNYTIMCAYIDMIINITENKMGEVINYDDFFKIKGMCDSINIIKPTKQYKKKVSKEQKFNDIGFRNIITAIRNGLMHNRYYIKNNGIYIHSKDAWQQKTSKKDENGKYIIETKDFEAILSLDFLQYFILFCINFEKSLSMTNLRTNKIKRKKGFEANANNISIETFRGVKKKDYYMGRKRSVVRYKNLDFKRSYSGLSLKQKEFLSEYFKIHEFSYRNLCFVNMFLTHDYGGNMNSNELLAILGNVQGYLHNRDIFLQDLHGTAEGYIFKLLTLGDNTNKRKILGSDQDVESEIKKIIINNSTLLNLYNTKTKEKRIINIMKSYKYDLLSCEDFASSIEDYRKNYLKSLYLSKFYINNPKLELAQPQKRVGNRLRRQGRDYIMNRCKNNPDFYWSKDAKEKQINTFVEDDYRKIVFQNLTSGSLDNWIIRNIVDVEKIENNIIFCTRKSKDLSLNNKKILKENVVNIVKKRKEKLGTVTLIGEEEHIRNAFAHHNYTIVPGFNKILLWDPSIDDTPNWEKIYDLDELYQNAVDRVDEDYLDKK